MDKREASTTTSPSTGTVTLPTTPIKTVAEPVKAPTPKPVFFGFDVALGNMRHFGVKVARHWNEPDKYLTLENGKIICYRGKARSIWAPNQVDICALDWGIHGG